MLDHQKLYKELLELCKSAPGAFHYIDQQLVDGDILYRSFGYRLMEGYSYRYPSAQECRGHTFSIDENGDMIECVVLPMPKYFNLRENEYTNDLDLTKSVKIMDKVDGMMISTFIHEGRLEVMSKQSMTSHPAELAREILTKDTKYAQVLYDLTVAGYTVNLELTHPEARIVVNYGEEPKLTALLIRNRQTGEVTPAADVPSLQPYAASVYNVKLEDLLEQMKDWVDLEGVMVQYSPTLWFKVKCPWYLGLHRYWAQGLIRSQRKLFYAILTGQRDEICYIHKDNEVALNVVKTASERINRAINGIVRPASAFYDTHGHIESKHEYYKLAITQLDEYQVRIAMRMYSKQPLRLDLQIWNMYGPIIVEGRYDHFDVDESVGIVDNFVQPQLRELHSMVPEQPIVDLDQVTDV